MYKWYDLQGNEHITFEFVNIDRGSIMIKYEESIKQLDNVSLIRALRSESVRFALAEYDSIAEEVYQERMNIIQKEIERRLNT